MGAPGPLSAPPSSEQKRIYRVPVFSVGFCQALLEELEHFEQSDMPKGRPNTMNNYGVGETLPVYPGSEGARVRDSSEVLQAGCLPCSDPKEYHESKQLLHLVTFLAKNCGMQVEASPVFLLTSGNPS